MMTMMMQLNQVMMMKNLRHVKITCCILYVFFGNFYLLLFHQQVKNNFLNSTNKESFVCLGMLGGWLCFCVSISIIGALTAVIGDLATHVNIIHRVNFFLSHYSVLVWLYNRIDRYNDSHCICCIRNIFTRYIKKFIRIRKNYEFSFQIHLHQKLLLNMINMPIVQ